MIIESLINSNLVALRTSDTVDAALAFMAEHGVSELPIVDKNQLYNYARSTNLQFENGELPLKDIIPFNPFTTSVKYNQHFYEVVSALAAADLSSIAIVNDSNELIGIVDIKTINKQIANSLTYKGIGAIIIIETTMRDYAPSQITRLIEEHGAIVFGLIIEQTENDKIKVNIKINSTQTKQIIQSLKRFNYNVIDAYLAEDLKTDDSNYDAVLKFFDI